MTSVSDLSVLSSVPKLETNGSNWIIFSIHLKWTLQEQKAYGHLDGTAPKPADTAPADEQTTWLDNKANAVSHLANTLKLIIVRIIGQERAQDLAGELVTIWSAEFVVKRLGVQVTDVHSA
jgi:hypothetical protein